MALVIDTVTWATYEAEFRLYLKVPAPAEEEQLQDLLAEADIAADHWMANPFVDDDGVNTLVDLTLRSVKRGVFNYADTMRRSTGPNGPSPNVSSVKTGDLSEGYAVSNITRVTSEKLALDSARSNWFPFRKKMWR